MASRANIVVAAILYRSLVEVLLVYCFIVVVLDSPLLVAMLPKSVLVKIGHWMIAYTMATVMISRVMAARSSLGVVVPARRFGARSHRAALNVELVAARFFVRWVPKIFRLLWPVFNNHVSDRLGARRARSLGRLMRYIP